ncbi:hypothetical protein IB277_14775 [Ensifer sp. ENS07]|uniref:hypothetical protein n=1 Tax=unclassified Ensifer TaxID=2633371 RepID=UPI00177AA69F|nr:MULTISPECIES: hypothetical protein [unclassified Ensifer]MBD9507935.1 hypothetical protein [Ensifer sp. ENS10]MBD9637568.1 hypothetical protein [Ensifer sp. ENS07]
MKVYAPNGFVHEPLPEAIARHRHAFEGGNAFALLIMPDGSSFFCREAGGEDMNAEHLDYQQTIARLIEIYGLSAFKGS